MFVFCNMLYGSLLLHGMVLVASITIRGLSITGDYLLRAQWFVMDINVLRLRHRYVSMLQNQKLLDI